MASLEKKQYDSISRMRLTGLVKLASKHTAKTWPMHTFISRNPLHDLEHLDFNEAVQTRKQHMGGEGYLSNQNYRDYLKTGRIPSKNLDAALKTRVSENAVIFGKREITHLEVLHAHFVHGFSAPSPEILETTLQNNPDYSTIQILAKKLSPFLKSLDVTQKIESFAKDDKTKPGKGLTLSGWLDHVFAQNLTEKINQEMIKWCLPFLDEGQAPWALPFRENGFYQAWKKLAAKECNLGGMHNIGEKIALMPERPADLLLENLEILGIPEPHWENYLSLHLSAIPGWTTLIKWRAEHQDYTWQEAYPVDLLQYLAIRLWYEREWVAEETQTRMGITGDVSAITAYISKNTAELFMRRERNANRLSASYTEAVDQRYYCPPNSKDTAWETLAAQYAKEENPKQKQRAALSAAWRLVLFSKACSISFETLLKNPAENLQQVLSWIDASPETSHGPIWLEAFENTFQKTLLKKLKGNLPAIENALDEKSTPERPLAQAVFCIDVRSESFRRYFEKTGLYETFGFAGFFIAFIRYLGFGSHHETDLYPAVAKAKNVVREVPRPQQGKKIPRYHAGTTFIHAIHTLLHDLKENVITPYIMVESMGWFFSIPLIGKTLWPKRYQKGAQWIKKRLVPPIATTLTLEKTTRESVDRMIASEQGLIIKEALRTERDGHKKTVSAESIQALRKLAMERGTPDELLNETEQKALAPLFQSSEKLTTFVQTLREKYYITEAWASARMERITRTGFSEHEQILTVTTALKMMGLTKNFAKLILFCGHGSTSDNNPYESALDCGACGGNPGAPNARVIAALSNKAHVRAHLKKEGIDIPKDTYFISGQHNTTTDEVVIHDLEDLPSTHKDALAQLILDLKQAGKNNSQERCRRFPDVTHELSAQDASQEVIRRSATWSQTRPEWGLSKNAAIIISRNQLIQNIDLEGRTFLHSYRHEEDPTGQFLEIILTGPQVVAQWINMEYYFSTTDNEAYGSGSKIYHNVAGRVGVMDGPTSDLRMGLPWQTVGNGSKPYHEAMRLFTIIEAPQESITRIIKQHTVLQEHFNNRWVHLVALDKGQFYRYLPGGTWQAETAQT